MEANKQETEKIAIVNELGVRLKETVQTKLIEVMSLALKNSKPNYEKIEKFKAKYVAASEEFIAERLIKSTSRKTALNASVGNAIVSLTQVSAIKEREKIAGTVAVTATVAAMAQDIANSISMQIQLLADIAALYDAEFDLDDEEDVWIIFLMAAGIKLKGDTLKQAGIIFEEAGIKNLRKLLRYKSSRANLQKLVQKVFGPQLAKIVSEKSILRIVPIANIALGAGLNYYSTGSVGRTGIRYSKTRSAIYKHIDRIQENEGDYKIPIFQLLRFLSEYQEDDKTQDAFAFAWRSASSKLMPTEDEINDIEGVDNIKDEYLKIFSNIETVAVKEELYNMAETVVATLKKKQYKPYLQGLNDLANAANTVFNANLFNEKYEHFNKEKKNIWAAKNVIKGKIAKSIKA